MHRELTNLLPLERRRALRRDYVLRLGVIAALFVSALFFIAAALLLPTYVFLTGSFKVKETHLANIESTLSSVSQKTISDRLAALSDHAATLIAITNTPFASVVIREVLAIPRPGITLSGFVYTPAARGRPGVVTVSGTAATRDTLRNYQLALEGASFALSADLPVSAYAKDTAISFTITVTLAP
ncbi:MAG: hypothetical protein KGJ31_02845 [Patescibacteria group bacterium]|nr:hypothetical protein [Patescibacteria group bacterium]